jgi:pyruvate,water dikinase
MENKQISSGIPELDRVVGGILPGDNIVWQIDGLEHYIPFVEPFCQFARRMGKKLIYFRFAQHPPLISGETGAEIHHLHPEEGFENFLFEVHRVIEESGRGAFYVFDCLSDLVEHWHSDEMLGNFFMLTCPFLYDFDTVTFFPLMRGAHSSRATAPITETTQLFLDVHHYKGNLYVRPIKVLHRYSSHMHMLHAWRDSDLLPVSESVVIAEILSSVPRPELESGGARLDNWRRAFDEAERALDDLPGGSGSGERADRSFQKLLRMAISRDERILSLCQKHLTLSDILSVGKRMIGTGLIGGKSVGMLLSRAILMKADERWADLLEVHDSFYIASDVFYAYLVRNGCWWVRESQRNPDTYLKGIAEARRQILRGSFPDHLVRQFSDMLDYFGQSPIIVRSSSLLEDNFGNAFAGKYESVFCANQGPRAQRLEAFMSAVRTIYTSTMSDDALQYRARRGLLDRDEQMALLVQRVSGSMNGSLFYPQLAGVGFSFNPYVWSEDIDAKAGVLRLVFGLGTRAVDRSDDDYTRVVALNAPQKRPEDRLDRMARFAQRKVDVLDLATSHLTSNDFPNVVAQSPQLPLAMFASKDRDAARFAKEKGMNDVFPWMLTFDGVLSETPFVDDMRDILRILEEAYDYPVDIEFTTNLLKDGNYKINLLQCRPLQLQGGGVIPPSPPEVKPDDLLLESQGAVIGHSRLGSIGRIIYVDPAVYGELPMQNRHAVARLVGRVAHLEPPAAGKAVMLLGPGRWGTASADLGVPVSFAEINTVSILCEIVAMREDLVPDVSLGTHFFSEMVEMDMLYLALFPTQDGNSWNDAFFQSARNSLQDLLPDVSDGDLAAVKVVEIPGLPGGRALKINANTLKQRVVCYFHDK